MAYDGSILLEMKLDSKGIETGLKSMTGIIAAGVAGVFGAPCKRIKSRMISQYFYSGINRATLRSAPTLAAAYTMNGGLMFSFTLRAAGAFFPYVFGHYWNKSSTAGTIASLIVGSIVAVIYEKKLIPGLGFFGWEQQPVIPGLVCALLVFIIFSLIMPPKTQRTELTE